MARQNLAEKPRVDRSLSAVPIEESASRRDFVERLLSNPFFAKFEPEIVEVLAPHCHVESLPDGAVVMRNGDASGDIFVMDEGCAQIVVPVEGVEQLVAEVGSGGVLGELSLILEEPHGATVLVKDYATLIRIPHSAFRAIVSSDPRWPSALLKLVARKLKNTTEPLAHLRLLTEKLVSDNFDTASLDSLEATGSSLEPLSQTFQSMARYVTERAQRLEREVAERTRELTQEIARRQEVEEELRRLASTDPLTGASNRRAFFEAGERELERAKRYGRPIALLMMDIDHFKQVNDKHGHAVGDAVLQAFSARCAEGLRSQDILGRLGGEEFAILAPECGPKDGEAFAERLRRSVAALRVPGQGGGDDVQCTMSVGLIDCDTSATLDHLLDRADKALYQAKQAGRDRVVVG